MSDRLEEARALIGQGRFEDAERSFAAHLNDAPNDLDALYGLGFSRLARTRHEEALEPLRRVVAAAPDHAKAWNALGSALLALDRAAEATEAFEAAVGASGAAVPDYLVNHAVAARAAGAADRALGSLDNILARAPNAAPAHLLRAEALVDLGDLDAARDAADTARHLAPDDPTAHFVAGRVELVARRAGAAIQRLERAAALSPQDPDILTSLGHARALAEDARGAGEAYRAAEEKGADTGERLAELSLGWERLNEIDEATRLATRALDADPEGYRANVAMAAADRRSSNLDAAARRLGRLRERAEASSDAGPLFALGQVLDRLGHAEEAWDAFLAANRFAAAKPRAADLAEKERLELRRIEAAVASLAPFEVSDDTTAEPPPIFVVGFPRSGTTLVDRILGAHSRIGVLEEKPVLERIQARFEALVGPYPDALGKADVAAIAGLREFYRGDTRDLGVREPTVLDKHPLNMKRVGLMRLLFPDAPVVLVDRHPMDAVLSCLMQDFRLNQAMARFNDQAETARAFLENRHLFDSLVRLLGVSPVRVRYEDLVTDPRRWLEPVLWTVGLKWEPEMDEFQQRSVRGKIVRSASYAQVTETVTDRSVGRWRDYRESLSEAEKLLAPICEELGYAL